MEGGLGGILLRLAGRKRAVHRGEPLLVELLQAADEG
jgi:hypothetical protein